MPEKMMPVDSESNAIPPLQTPLNPDERDELEQLRAEVAYLKKLQALLREKSMSKRGIKRRS